MVDLTRLRVSFLAGTLGQGGAERQLYYMVRALKQAGAEPRVLTFSRGEQWEQHILDLSIPVVWVGQAGSPILRVAEILKELRRHSPDVFQSLHFYTNAYVGLCGVLAGLRTLASMRNNGLSELVDSGRIRGLLGLRVPTMIAANSMEAIRFAQAHGISPRRISLLSNVVDTDRFVPVERPHRETVHLLAVGRMHKQKRLDRFVRLIARLQSLSSISVRGTIVGTEQGQTSTKGELRQLACDLNLKPDILEFCGPTSDMAPLYQKSDVYVLTSDYEGTPNVVLEAMSSGMPVVATRVGGVPDIVVPGETGFLVDPGDDRSLCDAVSTLVAHRERRRGMGEKARQFVLQNHSPVRLAQQLGEIYTRVLQ